MGQTEWRTLVHSHHNRVQTRDDNSFAVNPHSITHWYEYQQIITIYQQCQAVPQGYNNHRYANMTWLAYKMCHLLVKHARLTIKCVIYQLVKQGLEGHDLQFLLNVDKRNKIGHKNESQKKRDHRGIDSFQQIKLGCQEVHKYPTLKLLIESPPLLQPSSAIKYGKICAIE